MTDEQNVVKQQPKMINVEFSVSIDGTVINNEPMIIQAGQKDNLLSSTRENLHRAIRDEQPFVMQRKFGTVTFIMPDALRKAIVHMSFDEINDKR